MIHLFACVVSLAGVYVSALSDLQSLGALLWILIVICDLPISAVVFGFTGQHPALAMGWILVAGTYWWYILSRAVRPVFSLICESFKGVRRHRSTSA
jgi:hypothetical protein